MLGLSNACSSSSYIPFSTTKSLAFDGINDYLDVGDNLDLGTGDFSISMWVYVTEATNNILMSKWQDANNFWVLRTQADDKIQFIAVIGGLTILSHISSEAISQNVWVHVVYTNDRSNGSTGERIYIDGVLKGTGGASSTTDIDNTGSLYIGRYDTTYTLASTKMDEVAIWSTNLSGTAVSSLYNDKNPTDLKSSPTLGIYYELSELVSWWRMGDGAFDNISVVHDQVNPGFGSDLVSDGDFATDIIGWTGSDAAAELEWDNGKIKVTNGDGTAAGVVSAAINVEIGKTYLFSFESSQGTSVNELTSFGFGTSTTNVNKFWLTGPTSFTTDGLHSHIYIADFTGTGYVTVKNATAVINEYMLFDNISVKQLNGNPASVIGGVTSFSDDFSNSFN